MSILHRINIGISIVVFTVCCGVFLLFGWSGSGWKALTVPTGSMRPTITPGSMVLVHRVPIASLKVGDVITYINPLDPKTTLSHRILKKIMIDGTVPGFITKGDANKLPDIPFAAGAVEGQVVWHVPHVGYWMLDAKKPMVTLPIVYLAALLIMIEEVKRLADYYKSRAPYRLAGYELHILAPKRSYAKLYTAACLFLGAIGALAYFGPEAIAAQGSNVVTLTENRITVVGSHKPPPCTCKTTTTTTNNTSVTVTNTTNQNATSGNSQSSNGNAASGGTTNTNGTNANTNIDNTTTNGP